MARTLCAWSMPGMRGACLLWRVTAHPEMTFTLVGEEFEYYVGVPAEKFEPQVPESFVHAHPDEIPAPSEK